MTFKPVSGPVTRTELQADAIRQVGHLRRVLNGEEAPLEVPATDASYWNGRDLHPGSNERPLEGPYRPAEPTPATSTHYDNENGP